VNSVLDYGLSVTKFHRGNGEVLGKVRQLLQVYHKIAYVGPRNSVQAHGVVSTVSPRTEKKCTDKGRAETHSLYVEVQT
jgi:hypothetical protein